MISVEIDTSGLEKAIAEFTALGKKSLEEVTNQQAGIMVGHLIAITPPGNAQVVADSGGIGLAAKKQGESRAASDIAKIFPATKLPYPKILGLIDARHKWKTDDNAQGEEVFRIANSIAEMKRIHDASRNPRTGRTRKMGGNFMAIVRPALLKDYIKQQLAKVGLLNAGWIAAAIALKTASRATPQWIKRHGAKNGGCDKLATKDMVSVRIFNNQAWFPQSMDARLRDSIRRRENGLRKAIEAIIERRSKAANSKMT